jgi:hypothetical protein
MKMNKDVVDPLHRGTDVLIRLEQTRYPIPIIDDQTRHVALPPPALMLAENVRSLVERRQMLPVSRLTRSMKSNTRLSSTTSLKSAVGFFL